MEKRRKGGLNKYLRKLRLKASHIWRRYGASDSESWANFKQDKPPKTDTKTHVIKVLKIKKKRQEYLEYIQEEWTHYSLDKAIWKITCFSCETLRPEGTGTIFFKYSYQIIVNCKFYIWEK